MEWAPPRNPPGNPLDLAPATLLPCHWRGIGNQCDEGELSLSIEAAIYVAPSRPSTVVRRRSNKAIERKKPASPPHHLETALQIAHAGQHAGQPEHRKIHRRDGLRRNPNRPPNIVQRRKRLHPRRRQQQRNHLPPLPQEFRRSVLSP